MEYYYGEEAKMFTFYRIPKLLFTDPRYKPLSTDAKLLYGLMLDRMGLSVMNRKQDAQGRTYIFFRQSEAMELLNIKKDKVIKLYRELEEAQLIERRRQGFTHPDIIYVGRLTPIPTPGTAAPADEATEPSPQEASFPQSEEFSTIPEAMPPYEVGKTDFWQSEKPTSETLKNRLQEVGFSHPYHSNIYSNENQGVDLSIYRNEAAQTHDPTQTEDSPPPFEIEATKRIFKANIDYDNLHAMKYPGIYEPSRVEELLNLMVDEFTSHKSTVRAAGVDRPREEFRRRLLTVDTDSILRILYKLENRDPADRRIINRRAYLITMLYNHASIDPTPYEDTL